MPITKPITNRITTGLWFDDQAEEAANFYIGIFPNSRITQQCGWLKDRYGLSWQVVPRDMGEMFAGGDAAGTERAMTAMLRMKKIDMAELRRARDGSAVKTSGDNQTMGDAR